MIAANVAIFSCRLIGIQPPFPSLFLFCDLSDGLIVMAQMFDFSSTKHLGLLRKLAFTKAKNHLGEAACGRVAMPLFFQDVFCSKVVPL